MSTGISSVVIVSVSVLHTPTQSSVCQVPLCGHATLAAAHVLFKDIKNRNDVIRFRTRESGDLVLRLDDQGRIQMTLPVKDSYRIADLQPDARAGLLESIGCNRDWLGKAEREREREREMLLIMIMMTTTTHLLAPALLFRLPLSSQD